MKELKSIENLVAASVAATRLCRSCFSPQCRILSVLSPWCQQLPRFPDKPGPWSFPPRLRQSGLSAFLPVSDRLVAQESLLKPTRLERCP